MKDAALAVSLFMHTGVQRKYVIKPINRFDDGRPAREWEDGSSRLDCTGAHIAHGVGERNK